MPPSDLMNIPKPLIRLNRNSCLTLLPMALRISFSPQPSNTTIPHCICIHSPITTFPNLQVPTCKDPYLISPSPLPCDTDHHYKLLPIVSIFLHCSLHLNTAFFRYYSEPLIPSMQANIFCSLSRLPKNKTKLKSKEKSTTKKCMESKKSYVSNHRI